MLHRVVVTAKSVLLLLLEACERSCRSQFDPICWFSPFPSSYEVIWTCTLAISSYMIDGWQGADADANGLRASADAAPATSCPTSCTHDAKRTRAALGRSDSGEFHSVCVWVTVWVCVCLFVSICISVIFFPSFWSHTLFILVLSFMDPRAPVLFCTKSGPYMDTSNFVRQARVAPPRSPWWVNCYLSRYSYWRAVEWAQCYGGDTCVRQVQTEEGLFLGADSFDQSLFGSTMPHFS